MCDLLDPHWWTIGFGSLLQFILFLRWLYRRIRNDEITRAFVEDMATNHLPHISTSFSKSYANGRELTVRRVRASGGST